ncbi:MAG: hypothetical protein KDJ24_13960 [Gammaproteobacteria bacterium]|nr:hypothetical protein [Gammaproteobacteria bacterium]
MGAPMLAVTLADALAAADAMRTRGEDPQYVAHWLLRMHERCEQLENLLRLTERYLVFGMPEHELAEMEQLVERLREQEFAADDDGAAQTLPL